MGWRARIGVIYPADGDTDDDYYQLVPPGVTVHFSRNEAPFGEDMVQCCKDHLGKGYIEAAAKLLTPIRPDAIGYACSSGSFVGGVGYDQKIISVIERVTGSPATTCTTAAVKALKALGVKKVALATPYEEARNQILIKFMEDSGFEVVGLKEFPLLREMGDWPTSIGLTGALFFGSDFTYRLGKQADHPMAEAIVFACSGFRAKDVVERLEQDLGKPVVIPSQALIWDALRLSGVGAKMENLGQLYRL